MGQSYFLQGQGQATATVGGWNQPQQHQIPVQQNPYAPAGAPPPQQVAAPPAQNGLPKGVKFQAFSDDGTPLGWFDMQGNPVEANNNIQQQPTIPPATHGHNPYAPQPQAQN